MLDAFAGNRERAGGFSLVELMIVVAIVAILAAVAVPAYFNHTMRSRQSAVIGELMSIRAAQERFFAENGRYAGSLDMDGLGYDGGGYSATPIYTSANYNYFVVAGTNAMITTGTIRAEGDPNGDGNFYDVWELSINNLDDKPKLIPDPDPTKNEGFTWSSLGSLFD